MTPGRPMVTGQVRMLLYVMAPVMEGMGALPGVDSRSSTIEASCSQGGAVRDSHAMLQQGRWQGGGAVAYKVQLNAGGCESVGTHTNVQR